MWKKRKNKSILKKCYKFLVNWQPMSQVVYWSIILGIYWLMAIEMFQAKMILDRIYWI